eukprot:Pgem_evm1s18031
MTQLISSSTTTTPTTTHTTTHTSITSISTTTTTPTATRTSTISINTTTKVDQKNVQELMVDSNANNDNVNNNSVLIPAIGAACGAVALVGVVAGVVYGIKRRNEIAYHKEHQAFPEHGIIKLGVNDCYPIFDCKAKENPIIN